MSANEIATSETLASLSTEKIKEKLIELTRPLDTDSMGKKVRFANEELKPWFEELTRRNPFPDVQEQINLVLGVWQPIWSTIPFQDTLPGRLRNQSYQIFHDDGYYANMARYAPGKRLPFVNRIASFLFAYDLMIIQKYELQEGQWYIENVSIEQALRPRGIPLSASSGEDWFNKALKSRLQKSSEEPKFSMKNVDKSTAKKYEKVFGSTPQLEHLYIDSDFRLVKSRREASQRPSYTIAVRVK